MTPAQPNDVFAKSVDSMRGTARWTLAAFAAVGTILVAGSQLANIGQFKATDVRLWIAVSALAVVLGVVGFAVRFVITVETAGETSLGDLAQEETKPGSAASMFLRDNRALLGGFPSAAALNDAYQQAVQARYDAVAGGSQADIDAAQQLVVFLGDVMIFPLLSAVRYQRVRCAFDRGTQRIIIAAVVAGLAVGAFAWAANPPSQ